MKKAIILSVLLLILAGLSEFWSRYQEKGAGMFCPPGYTLTDKQHPVRDWAMDKFFSFYRIKPDGICSEEVIHP